MTIKFMVWNMEWMNDLFINVGTIHQFKSPRSKIRGGHSVQQRVDDLTEVINQIGPDLILVTEAPNTQGEFHRFFDRNAKKSQFKPLQGQWATHLQPTHGSSQAIGVACRIDKDLFQKDPIADLRRPTDPCSCPFQVDVDGDGIEEVYKFTRQPLYVEIRPKVDPSFHVLGVHLKSKGVFNAMEWSKMWRRADGNRQRIVAEAMQLRKTLIEPCLKQGDTGLLVCGDVNDGPGMDASEWKLRVSGVERLMGSVWRPEFVLFNALFDSLSDAKRAKEDVTSLSTTRFKDPILNDQYLKVWIDHLLYSVPRDRQQWVSGASIVKDLSANGETKPIWRLFPGASDHQPIVATLDPTALAGQDKGD